MALVGMAWDYFTAVGEGEEAWGPQRQGKEGPGGGRGEWGLPSIFLPLRGTHIPTYNHSEAHSLLLGSRP